MTTHTTDEYERSQSKAGAPPRDIFVTGIRWAPPFAQGLVRDLRVRWALEEVGLPYEVRLADRDERSTPAYRRAQPFGMVPVFEADGHDLFESGAIVHHIAERSEVLMPTDRQERARTLTWMFAALNTVEPPLQSLLVMDLQHGEEPWTALRRPAVVEEVKLRLAALATWLAGRDYLLGRFTAADVLMTTVLRLIRHTGIVAEYPALAAYRERCEARPAFQTALERQIAEYAESGDGPAAPRSA